jgi:hypothetical protein
VVLPALDPQPLFEAFFTRNVEAFQEIVERPPGNIAGGLARVPGVDIDQLEIQTNLLPPAHDEFGQRPVQ